MLAVDEWAVTFGTARRALDGAAARPAPSSLIIIIIIMVVYYEVSKRN